MHPHFKCRLQKTGGANAIAVRIARAAAKKDKCNLWLSWLQHWYLAANLKSKKILNNHLLKSSKPNGVKKFKK